MEPEKKKYRVIYDRQNCIGAGACVLAYSDRFTMNKNDDKADLIGGTKNSEQMWVVEFTLREFEEFKAAGEVCPVQVIQIIDVETGKRIV